MMLPCGWLCQCCRNVWAPFVAICPACNLNGQMTDEIRAMHDCPLWGSRIDGFFRGLEMSLAEKPFRVEPRPHIVVNEASTIPDDVWSKVPLYQGRTLFTEMERLSTSAGIDDIRAALDAERRRRKGTTE